MGMYECLLHTMTCPRCHQTAAMDFEVKWGNAQLRDIKIGDRVSWWVPRTMVKNGGRPDDGTMDWDGYTECPNCHRDFFVWVHVVNDVITGVSVDTTREGYIKDDQVGSG